jgi:hypothetical protein
MSVIGKIRLGYQVERETNDAMPVIDIRDAWRSVGRHRNIPEDVGMAAGLVVNLATAYKRRWFGPHNG